MRPSKASGLIPHVALGVYGSALLAAEAGGGKLKKC